MAKILKAAPAQDVGEASPTAAKVVHNGKTGKPVTVRGVGALKDNRLEIEKGVSLLKPIAKQALRRRPDKRKAG